MRITAPTLLLLTAASAGQTTKTAEAFSFSPCPQKAVSFVKKVVGGAALATSVVVTSPLVEQQAFADALPPPVNRGAVVVNVDSSSVPPPVDIANQLWQHKSQIQAAFRDLLTGAQKAAADLDGVVSPQVIPKVDASLPADIPKTARDALTGQARVVVNGKPIYVQIDSADGFLDLHVISPLLPKIPFLEPTAEQKAGMYGYGMYEPPAEQEKTEVVVASVAADAATSLWKTTIKVPVVNVDVTVEQAAEAAVAALVGVYGTSYGYYSYLNYQEDQKAQEKKAKQAAAKAAKKKTPPPPPPSPPKVEPVAEAPKEQAVVMEEPETEMSKLAEKLPEAPKEESEAGSLMDKVKRVLNK